MKEQILAKYENSEVFVADNCGCTAMGLRVKTEMGDLIAYPNNDPDGVGIGLYYKLEGLDQEIIAVQSEVSVASDDSAAFFCLSDFSSDAKLDALGTLQLADADNVKQEVLARSGSNEIFLCDACGHTIMGLSVKTKAGNLIAFPMSAPDSAGIMLVFQQSGIHSERKVVFAQVSQDDGSDNTVRCYCLEAPLTLIQNMQYFNGKL